MDTEPQGQELQEKKGGMNLIIGAVVLVLVVAGAWWVFARGGAAPAADTGASAAAGADANAPMVPANDMAQNAAPMSATVTYTAQGFSPAQVTVAEGGTVTWVNQSGHPMWVASGVHPTHTVYDGTSKNEHCAAGYTGAAPFDECSAGDSYSFTFTKTGDWKYHNHAGAEDTGTVTVVAQ